MQRKRNLPQVKKRLVLFGICLIVYMFICYYFYPKEARKVKNAAEQAKSNSKVPVAKPIRPAIFQEAKESIAFAVPLNRNFEQPASQFVTPPPTQTINLKSDDMVDSRDLENVFFAISVSEQETPRDLNPELAQVKVAQVKLEHNVNTLAVPKSTNIRLSPRTPHPAGKPSFPRDDQNDDGTVNFDIKKTTMLLNPLISPSNASKSKSCTSIATRISVPESTRGPSPAESVMSTPGNSPDVASFARRVQSPEFLSHHTSTSAASSVTSPLQDHTISSHSSQIKNKENPGF